ncbi:hypothetical protein [Nostoc sp. FACHB-190]|uniref:hypothetical protein n=1 Tax=Nostoc sp. FACHB-190 TaxID=2692838 RepID=UPI0016897BC9|nr:hypothetical protein [Nostoc sp. FACHB-190]MBD2303677.1 hypothetical protein [Nostoc sp. FACHB-190]
MNNSNQCNLSKILATMTDAQAWLRKELNESRKNEQPTQALMKFLVDQKINLALVPEKYGGLEFDLIQEMWLIKYATKLDPALGFIVFQLCGNVGRVLSFLSDTSIMNLLEETKSRLILCYQNNFNIATIKNSNSGWLISGSWPFASLSRCATHFVLPYIQQDGSRCCLVVNKDAVEIPLKCKGLGLKATSTTGYIVNNYLISKADIKTHAIPSNPNFLPRYSIARAPIKHAAWTMGIGERLLQIRRTNIVESEADIDKIFTQASNSMVEDIEVIEKRIKNNLDCIELFTILTKKNRFLNSWLLELGIATYLSLPELGADPESDITNLICDLMTLSLHSNVREQPLLTWGTSQSVPAKLLTKLVQPK